MSAAGFGVTYSRYYDSFNQGKNYERECAYLERIFRRYSREPVRKVLDIACGTGGHAMVLAGRGYEVTARDISVYMLEVARRKANEARLGGLVTFKQADMRSYYSHSRFDACICMFNSLGYVLDDKEVRSTFENVWNQLRPSGVFVFDFWNSSAVIAHWKARRSRPFKYGRYRGVRTANTTRNAASNLLTVKANVTVFVGRRAKEDIVETHNVRYFSQERIRSLLRESGFRVASIHPFLRIDARPGAVDWGLTAVALKE